MYGELETVKILSYVLVSVTNNNGFWIGWLDLLALLYNYNQLQQLKINDWLRLASFFTGLRVSSLPLWLTGSDLRIGHFFRFLCPWLTLHSWTLNFWILLRINQPFQVKVKVTLRLAVYRQSVHLGLKPFEPHDQRFFFQLNPCGKSLCNILSNKKMGLSFMNMLGLSSNVHFAHIACYSINQLFFSARLLIQSSGDHG
jgi:hypothetical protein